MKSRLPAGVSNDPEGDIARWVAAVDALCRSELNTISPDALVVDVCSGEGGVARALLPTHRIVGVEYSHMRCRRGKARVAMICADACHIPLADHCAGAVLFFEGIEHVADPVQALAEVRRVLTAGGLLLISTPNTVWISLRRWYDHGALYPPHIRRDHRREYSFGFPAFLARQGFMVQRRTSPDPLGASVWRKLGLSIPDPLRWWIGCSQLLVAHTTRQPPAAGDTNATR